MHGISTGRTYGAYPVLGPSTHLLHTVGSEGAIGRQIISSEGVSKRAARSLGQ